MFNTDNLTAERNFVIADTTQIQTESLIRFAAGVGYEAMFDTQNRLRSFRAPQFDACGAGRLSVRTMIHMHNNGPVVALEEIKKIKTIDELYIKGHFDAAVLFAATLKLVKKVNGQGSRKEGLIIQGHMVKFTSYAVYNQLKQYVENN